MKKKTSNTVKILLTIALLLAAGTGVLAWVAFGPSSAPVEAEASAVEAPPETTEAVTPTAQETVPIVESQPLPTQETAAAVENWTLPTQETSPSEEASEEVPAVLKLAGWRGGPLKAEEPIYKEQIATITFLDSLADAPADAWDATEAKDGAILAWTVPNSDAEGLLDLYIGSEQVIYGGSSPDLSGFCNLRKLNNLNLLNISGAESLKGMFSDMGRCSGVPLELDLFEWDVSSVTNFSGMFSGSSLTSIDLSGWDVSSGTDFSYMFSGTPLTSIDLTSWKMSRAKYLQNMFNGCAFLERATLNGWDLSSVVSTNAMFSGCGRLYELNMAGWELPADCLTDHMLYGCQSLGYLDEIVSRLNLKPEPTQADFADKFTELTTWELEVAREIEFMNFCSEGLCDGDLGQLYPELANLDLDKDGKRDSIQRVLAGDEEGSRTFELHLGNGNVTPLEFKTLYAGYSIAFLFGDVNQTGKDDLLVVYVSHSTAGNLLDFLLFTDSGDRYYKQELPKVQFSLEDMQNDYVRLSCAQNPHREIFLMDGAEKKTFMDGKSTYECAFPESTNFDDICWVRDVKMDGNKLIVLYSIMNIYSSNPFGVVWRLEPGGYFVIERMGTDVIRDYWLTE